MQAQNSKTTNRGRLSKHQKELSFQYNNYLIANLSEEDQDKMVYVKQFIDNSLFPVLEEGDDVTLGPMDSRMLHYLLYCFLLGYEATSTT